MDAPFTLVPTKVPAGNICVPEADFELLYAELALWREQPEFDNYVFGVEQALAWVADRRVVEDGRAIVPHPPLSGERYAATPETITFEYLYAIEERNARPGNSHVRGVLAALDWVRNGGRRPLPEGWLAG